MENIATFLKWTIGVCLTLTIIMAGVALWNKVVPIITTSHAQAAQQARAVADDEYSAYDNQIISGSQVLTAYRRYSYHDVFYLYIQTNNNSSTLNFGMQPNGSTAACAGFDYSTGKLVTGTTSCSIALTQVTDNTSSYYIPPQARFRAAVLKDGNDRVTGIFFKAQ